MFFGPQNISFNDQDMIYHNNTQLSLKSGDLTKFTLHLASCTDDNCQAGLSRGFDDFTRMMNDTGLIIESKDL